MTEVSKITADDLKLPLRDAVKESFTHYLSEMNHSESLGVYDVFLQAVEVPLLRVFIKHTGFNQVKMARMLGISRTTLRNKLRKYALSE